MRRVALIVAGLLLAALLIALPAIGSNGAERHLPGQGHTSTTAPSSSTARRSGSPAPRSGTVESVDVSSEHEIASDEGGPHAVPGQGGRRHEDQRLRLQGLPHRRQLPDPPAVADRREVHRLHARPSRARPGTPPPPPLQQIPDGQPGARPVPPAAREQRQDRRPRSDPEHPAAALRRPLPASSSTTSAPASPGRGQDLGEVIDRANPALRQTDRVLAILAAAEPAAGQPGEQRRHGAEAAGATTATHVTGFFHNAAISGAGDRRAQRRPSRRACASSPRPSVRSA